MEDVFDLFDLFDDDKPNQNVEIIREKKDGNCIICGVVLETVLDEISGVFEPILCPSCTIKMVKNMNGQK